MYELVILEDKQEHVKLLEGKLALYERRDAFSIRAFTGIDDFEAYLKTGAAVDIVLMDIEFDACGTNGIDVVAKHFPQGSGTQVIYVTGYIEYCTQVYRTEHQYFIVKPIKQQELDEALDKALAALAALANNPMLIKVEGRYVKVLPGKIVYIESLLRKLAIHTANGVLETYGALTAIREELPSCFVQCHKSFLVNMDYVEALQKDGIRLRSGELIPVSQSRNKEVREAFMGYLGRAF